MFPAYPWDRSSLKSMSLDLRQFEKLDTYASQVREHLCVRWLGESRVRLMSFSSGPPECICSPLDRWPRVPLHTIWMGK